MKQDPKCIHGCKEFCTALGVAMLREKEAILQYGTLRDECDYPDVKAMLNELIIRRQKSIQLLEDVKNLMKAKFEILDQIQEGFGT